MEFIKKLNEIERSIEQKLNRLAINVFNESKIIIRKIAYDTGDMEGAVIFKKARLEGGQLVAEVLVDPNKLYNKRKASKSGKVNRLYPIYVHQGVPAYSRRSKYQDWVHPGMKARPYFNMAWELVRQKPEFRDFAKNIVTRGINET